MTAVAILLALGWLALAAWLAVGHLPALEAFARDTPALALLAGVAVLLPPILLTMLAIASARLNAMRATLTRVERRLARTNAVAHAVEARVADVAEEIAPPAPSRPPVRLGDADLLRALALPHGPDDTAGFDAVRRALANAEAGPAVEAAGDVLNRLAADGIRTDALAAELATPLMWRGLAAGATPTRLGRAQDPAVVAQVRARLSDDTSFANEVERFLLAFERLLAAWAPHADDDALARLTDTRTARTYALVGRAAGLFDEDALRAEA